MRFTFLVLILYSLLTVSCSGRKHKLDKRNLIPEKELISLLTDIHIADGLLNIPKINSWYSSLDSITTYCQVIEKHGYTKEIMDKTMNYYFIKKPKKLNKIYDQVLGILSAMESRFEKESNEIMTQIPNSWPGKKFYSLPDLSGNDTTLFDLTLNTPGTYTLTYSATLFPDDQAVNPGASVYLCSPDSIETGKRNYVKTAEYLKDGRSHTYILTFKVPEKKILHLRGWLYDFNSSSLKFEKHAMIEDISITFSSSYL